MAGGSISNVNLTTSWRPDQIQASAKAAGEAIKSFVDKSSGELTKLEQIMSRLDKYDLAKLSRIANSISSGRFTDSSLERNISTAENLAFKYGSLRRDSEAGAMFQSMVTGGAMLRSSITGYSSGYGSPAYNAYMGAHTGSIAGDMNIQNLQRALSGVESSFMGGARPNGQMAQEVQRIADGFRSAARSAHEYWEELGRIQNLQAAIAMQMPAGAANPVDISSFQQAMARGQSSSQAVSSLLGRIGAMSAAKPQASADVDLIGNIRAMRRGDLQGMRNANRQLAGMMPGDDDWYGMSIDGYRASRQMQAREIMSRERANDAWKQQVLAGSRDRSDAIARASASPRRLGPMGMTDLSVLGGDDFYAEGRARATDLAERKMLRDRLRRAVDDSQATGIGLRTDGRAIMGMTDLRDIWSDEKQLKKRQGLITAKMEGEEDIGVRTQLSTTSQIINNRLASALQNPEMFRSGRGSRQRMANAVATNIGYGIEDFMISSQYGGLPMAIRSVANNITPIIAGLGGAGIISSGLTLPMMAGAAFAAAGTSMYAQRSQEQSQERIGRVMLMEETNASKRAMTRDLSRAKLGSRSDLANQLDAWGDDFAGLGDERKLAAAKRMATMRENAPSRFGFLLDEMTGGLYDSTAGMRESPTEELANRELAMRSMAMLRNRSRLESMLGAESRRSSVLNDPSNYQFLSKNATFAERAEANEVMFRTQRRAIEAGYGREGADPFESAQYRDARSRLLRDQGFSEEDSRAQLKMQAREAGRDLLEGLTEDADFQTGAYAKNARRTARQIMGNPELTLVQQLEGMQNVERLFEQGARASRISTPPSANMAIEGMDMASYTQRLMTPTNQQPGDVKVQEEIRDILKEIKKTLSRTV